MKNHDQNGHDERIVAIDNNTGKIVDPSLSDAMLRDALRHALERMGVNLPEFGSEDNRDY